MLVSFVLQSPFGSQQVTAETGMGAMLLFANIVIFLKTGGYFDAPAGLNPLLQTWSLFSRRAVLSASSGEPSRRLLVGAAKTSHMDASPGHRGRQSLLPQPLAFTGSRTSHSSVSLWLIGFYGPLGRIWEFGAGALLAMWTARHSTANASQASKAGLSAMGAIVILICLMVVSGESAMAPFATIFPVIGTGMLLVGGSQGGSAVQGLLSNRAMVAVGDRSYSWYLRHWPLIVFATSLWPRLTGVALLAAGLSIIPAIVAFRFIEQPLRALQLKGGRSWAILIAPTLAVPLGLAIILFIAAYSGYWNSGVRQMAAAITTQHASSHCTGGIESIGLETCTWNATSAGKPLYLIGDSNADHFGEAAIAASTALERPLTVLAAGGCPTINVVSWRSDWPASWNDDCREFGAQVIDWIGTQPPGIVLLAISDVYWRAPYYTVGVPGAEPVSNELGKVAVFKEGLSDTISTLMKKGNEVAILVTVPHFSEVVEWEDNPYAWDPRSCTNITVLTGRCSSEMPLSYVADYQAPIRSAIDQVAARTGATVIDLRPSICTDVSCSTSRDGILWYRDGSHLSVSGSTALAERLTSDLGGFLP